MSAPILPADKTLRTKTLCWTALLAVLGFVGIRSLMVYLNELAVLQLVAPQLTAEKYARLLFFFGVANMLIAGAAGGALFSISFRTLKAGRFPPPGMRLLWDTKLRSGREARRIAVAGVALAIVLTLCGIGLGVVMVWIARAPIFGHTGPFLEAALVSGPYLFS